MIQLRDYQLDLIDRLRDAFRSGFKRVGCVAPTGAGKGVLLSFVAKHAVEKGLRVMVIAHRGEILDQLESTLKTVGVPIGIIRSGEHSPVHIGATVASVQTLVRCLDRTPVPDLVICDEFHHAVSPTWMKVFAQFPKAQFLGTSATPQRLDGRGLGEIFQKLVIGPSVATLIEEGFLARPRYFAPSHEIDFSKVKKIAGDYSKSEIGGIVDKPSITGDACSHYRRYLNGKTAVAFCISIQHCEHVAETFRSNGVRAAVVDGNLSDVDRKQRLSALASGEIQVLCSCEILGEGVDVPSVSGCILLRPTASLALFLQQVGRCLRPKPGDNTCTVLDHVGNTLRLGLAEEDREWTLEGRKKRDKNTVETKQCPKCYCVYAGRVCPECGEEREGKPREIEQRDGQLTEVSAADIAAKRALKAEEWQCRTYQDYVNLGRRRNYKVGWAYFRWKMSRWNPENKKAAVAV